MHSNDYLLTTFFQIKLKLKNIQHKHCETVAFPLCVFRDLPMLSDSPIK